MATQAWMSLIMGSVRLMTWAPHGAIWAPKFVIIPRNASSSIKNCRNDSKRPVHDSSKKMGVLGHMKQQLGDT